MSRLVRVARAVQEGLFGPAPAPVYIIDPAVHPILSAWVSTRIGEPVLVEEIPTMWATAAVVWRPGWLTDVGDGQSWMVAGWRPEVTPKGHACRYAFALVDRDGRLLATDPPGPYDDLISHVLTNMYFASSPLAEVQGHQRHGGTAARSPHAPPEVSVVRLRAVHRQAFASDPSAFVAWSCRWLVRGHSRREHTRTLRDGRTVNVSGSSVPEHVKGPVGRPFRPRVYRVDR